MDLCIAGTTIKSIASAQKRKKKDDATKQYTRSKAGKSSIWKKKDEIDQQQWEYYKRHNLNSQGAHWHNEGI